MEAIAFYLPQYHVIPENENIYGKGFTEWDNVRNATPQFPGHKQPKVPHSSIGYYNLLDENFLTFQHQLAWENGVKNFCYYYYNMNGTKLLLEKQIQLVHKNKKFKTIDSLITQFLAWVETGTKWEQLIFKVQ